ncbi:hypothetical protein BDQ94DRAFT_31557 [Aspergillus welwitschiae]|uniref:Uncharacterized protein n=1 Tax=Aspergillus welwitschiae TaxID=1341132 RepID=A0A3F3Q328_9EURO|nr:hypothetical protein BDQ94DRAFT_31557 [Aspergillus welwitschiae]RDH33609.1 hypothetical protein BDQ94DRAFT_31557 [Aspergillus welwitschiae]
MVQQRAKAANTRGMAGIWHKGQENWADAAKSEKDNSPHRTVAEITSAYVIYAHIYAGHKKQEGCQRSNFWYPYSKNIFEKS